MSDPLERARAKAQPHLDAIAKLFTGAPKLTLLVRHQDDPEGRYDFTLSTDDEAEVRKIVARRFGAPSREANDDDARDAARWRAIEWRWGSGTVTLDCDEKGFFRIQVEHAEAADEYVTGKDPADVLNKLMKFDAEHAEETTAPSAEARRIDYGSMWGFMRSVLTQGAAIYQDFAAGNLKDYEEYSARVDAAARERDDELKSLPSATAATWKPIATAPTDGTEILLTQWSEQDGYGETDFGSWGFIENSDADQQAIYGWLSNYGRVDEPTHWMEVATPDRSSQ